MKTIWLLTILALVLGCQSSTSVDMGNHPLNHSQFTIVDYPRGSWAEGWMYQTEVMEYLFKSGPERQLAISKLLKAGYGDSKIDYLYVNEENVSVNGRVFVSLERAKEYIRKKKLKRVLYTGKEIFPRVVPQTVTMDGVEFWLIDWRK